MVCTPWRAAAGVLRGPERTVGDVGLRVKSVGLTLPLVSRDWKNGSNSGYNCTPHSSIPY